MVDLETLRAQFISLYAGVPAKLREEIIALVDGRPFNWNSAFVEISGKTKVGNVLLEELVLIGLLKE